MLDLQEIRQTLDVHGSVVRVVIAAIKGSSPREVGAAMLVWEGGQSGTIGGGALELAAAEAARHGRADIWHSQHALGPELGQCCGGAVTLVFERWDMTRLNDISGDVLARRVHGATEAPMAVHRLMAKARAQGQRPQPQLIDGWMVEPVHRPHQPLWIWGAGHVGRALVSVMEPLPDFDLTWVDTGPERFPQAIPDHVTALPAADPCRVIAHAPADAAHLILTYSHDLDLRLCHGLLLHGGRFIGLIGSQTKWARFRNRLRSLGHSVDAIGRITCPIGDPTLGKHPHSIAIGVAGQMLGLAAAVDMSTPKEQRA